MKVAVASDHAGLDMKNLLAEDLRQAGYEVHDLGAHRVRSAGRLPGLLGGAGRRGGGGAAWTAGC